MRPTREVALAGGVGAALAVAMTWPLALRLGSHVPGDLGDPLLQTWQLGWAGRAVWPGGPALLDSNAWWPLENTFAFSDPPIGFAPLAVGVSSFDDAILRYGVAFLVAVALAWLGPYLLARQLGASPLGAAVTGTAVAWAPWRLAQVGHLHVLATGGIALSLALLVRGHQRASWPLVVAGWGVAAWQLTVSLSTGMPFGLLLALLSAGALAWWLFGRHRRPSRPVLYGDIAGIAGFVGVVAWRALPYLRVAEAHPDAVRTVAHLAIYSPPMSGFLTAPEASWLWGDATAGLRGGLGWPPEQTLFPGALVLMLALLGLGWSRAPVQLRLGLAGLVVVAGVLSLGVTIAGGEWTYLPLFDHVPGWRGMRTPGRLVAFVSLGLGILAAFGLDVLRRWLGRRSRAAGTGLAVVVAALVVLEGVPTDLLVPVPESPSVMADAPEPQLHLPSGEGTDHRYLAWSTGAGFPELVNGTGSFVPELLEQIREVAESFPDPQAVSLLRELGVRSVIVHGQSGEPVVHDLR